MKRALGYLALLASYSLAACNATLLEQDAPAIVSSEWVLPEKAAPPLLDDGRWRVLAFFAPT